MPVLYKELGIPGRVLSSLFFLCLSLGGISSLVAMIELPVHTLEEMRGKLCLCYSFLFFFLTMRTTILLNCFWNTIKFPNLNPGSTYICSTDFFMNWIKESGAYILFGCVLCVNIPQRYTSSTLGGLQWDENIISLNLNAGELKELTLNVVIYLCDKKAYLRAFAISLTVFTPLNYFISALFIVPRKYGLPVVFLVLFCLGIPSALKLDILVNQVRSLTMFYFSIFLWIRHSAVF